MTNKNINWDATAFFASLTETNKFAQTHNFVFAKVSGLDGFEEALQQLQSATAMPKVALLRKAPSSKKWAWFMPGNGWLRKRCLPTRLRVLSSTPWTMRSGLTLSDPYEPMM